MYMILYIHTHAHTYTHINIHLYKENKSLDFFFHVCLKRDSKVPIIMTDYNLQVTDTNMEWPESHTSGS